MEARPFLRLIQRAVATVVSQKPILPTCWQECDPEILRPSPPPSPCDEIIVVGFKGEWKSSKQPASAGYVGAAPLTHAAFNVV
jgi:hypothetical protein